MLNDFFKEENAKDGICMSAELLKYYKSLDDSQKTYISNLISHLSLGRDVNISSIYEDRFGVCYVYVKVNFTGGKGGKKFKVITFPNFEKFTDKLFDKRIGFQFNELINYAEKLQESKMDDAEIVVSENKPKLLKKTEPKILETN